MSAPELPLIELVYEAALEPQGWPKFLDALADFVRGTATVITFDDLERSQASIAEAVNVDPEAIRTYETEFVGKNIWQNSGRHLFKPGVVVTGEMTCSRSAFLKSEYYNEFLRHLGIFHGFGAVLAPEPGALGFLASFRAGSQGEFDRDTLDVVRRILPHVQRALQLRQRVSHLEWQRNAALTSLDRIGQAFVAVTKDATVICANAHAEHLLRVGNGLIVTGRRIAASRTSSTARLRQAIASAAAVGESQSAGCAVQVERIGGAPLRLLVCPLPRAHVLDRWGLESCVALFVSDPDDIKMPDAALLAATFGLTPAECRVLTALVGGLSVKETAAACGVSVGTVRWHLKRMTGKMGVSRQAEAVALAIRAVPPAQ